MEPKKCLQCRAKPCEKSNEGDFDTCPYGIVFLNRNGIIEKKEPELLLSNISRNLRHELNPVLQTIIQKVSFLDNSLSTKEVVLDNPLSVVVGATVIIDIFIQMITGVHEFDYSIEASTIKKKVYLENRITHYFDIYSIIKDHERANNLSLVCNIDSKITYSIGCEFIDYILAVLIDNAWKYSVDNSVFTINIIQINDNRIDIELVNESKKIQNIESLFDLGFKATASSKGFGYGLYWAKTLELYYNHLTGQEDSDSKPLSISHEQIENGEKCFQKFIIKNILID
jgi:signal transduction histidine kinase